VSGVLNECVAVAGPDFSGGGACQCGGRVGGCENELAACAAGSTLADGGTTSAEDAQAERSTNIRKTANSQPFLIYNVLFSFKTK